MYNFVLTYAVYQRPFRRHFGRAVGESPLFPTPLEARAGTEIQVPRRQKGMRIDIPGAMPRFAVGIRHYRDAYILLQPERETLPARASQHTLQPEPLQESHWMLPKDSLVKYCMNEEEYQQIFSAPNPDEAFITLWTRKEAVFKLKGTGINDDIKDILSPRNTEGICIQTVPNLYHGYILSVAQYSDAKIQLWK